MFWKCIIQVERGFCVVGPWTWRAFLMLISLFSLRFIACNIQKRIKIGLYVDHPVLVRSSGTEDRFVFRWSNKNVQCRAEHKNACIWIRIERRVSLLVFLIDNFGLSLEDLMESRSRCISIQPMEGNCILPARRHFSLSQLRGLAHFRQTSEHGSRQHRAAQPMKVDENYAELHATAAASALHLVDDVRHIFTRLLLLEFPSSPWALRVHLAAALDRPWHSEKKSQKQRKFSIFSHKARTLEFIGPIWHEANSL